MTIAGSVYHSISCVCRACIMVDYYQVGEITFGEPCYWYRANEKTVIATPDMETGTWITEVKNDNQISTV